MSKTLDKTFKCLKAGWKKSSKPLVVAVVLILLVFIIASKKSKNVVFLPTDLPETASIRNAFVSASQKPKPELPEFITIQGNSFRSVSPPYVMTPQVLGALIGGFDLENSQRTEIIQYIIEEGDSLSSISSNFNVSIDTIAWANDIKTSLIQPGQKLMILPVSGVMHLVESGDVIDELAKIYKTEKEKIISFNDLSKDGSIFEGEVLIIPDGTAPLSSSSWTSGSGLGGLSTNDYYGKSHSYPYGQCTWWVAQKRAVPSWGNAVDWINNAAAAGYEVCPGRYCIPRAGAIIYLKGHRIYGHVAYVERIEEGKVIFSEMNYIGLGRMNYRSLKMIDVLIQGYIY
ncbi:MAG: LysM peptidoglycan-binding domain-containing protein [Candidatus Nealsonbacteria bacterium]